MEIRKGSADAGSGDHEPADEQPRALVVDPNPETCWALHRVLERQGYRTECCLGPPSRSGPCPLLSTGHCPLVERTEGEFGLAVLALPRRAQFTDDIVREYTSRYGRVVIVDDTTNAAALTDQQALLTAVADELAAWVRSIVVGLAAALGGDASAPSRPARVVWTALQVLRRLDPDAAANPITEYGLLLRDIGTALSSNGRDPVRHHPVAAAELLRAIPPLRETIPIVRHHHERWDGEGFPDRLVGQKIPSACRAVAAADMLETLEMAGLEPQAVCAELTAARGAALDPDAVDILLRLLADGELGARTEQRPVPGRPAR